ncbi:hypothetical protein ZHAS_00012552 [Anopheles sinensis]|uniref:Uncharacterized protein n=1 Tax=Anopheles sinensis TaxID=74873 RepID=A0A084W373_ANOSI|nr:hypothetical protein ZHAS_00012552 [Anopheles sinensis]
MTTIDGIGRQPGRAVLMTAMIDRWIDFRPEATASSQSKKGSSRVPGVYAIHHSSTGRPEKQRSK